MPLLLPDSIYAQLVQTMDAQFDVVARTAAEGNRYYAKDAQQDQPQPTFSYVREPSQILEDGVMATGQCPVGSVLKDGQLYARIFYRFASQDLSYEFV